MSPDKAEKHLAIGFGPGGRRCFCCRPGSNSDIKRWTNRWARRGARQGGATVDAQVARERETLWQIDAPHFCCGLVVRDGRVVEAAPIVQWALGKPWAEVKAYFRRKGYHGVPVPAKSA